ncbi:MAG: type II toxin-antitoxin system HicA family toxin [Gordonia sp. (in: high G+C Gram-positive bacteria)]
MKRRELAARLRKAGFVARQGKGDHEVWTRGSLHVVITQSREVSPGLVRKALKAIDEAQKEAQ